MKIEKNKYVSLMYELRENNGDGKVIEEMDPSRPLSFVYGAGRLIAGFEAGIASLTTGDDFSFTVPSVEAYGERREDMIIDVPVSVFHKDGVLDEEICFVGNSVPMSDNQGRRIDGVINEISDEHVKMDFNHPMAGCDLYFSGKVVEVREATTEELQGNSHGSSCSGCGSHGDGCGGEC
jgi:FKBP-type peptidyl-prolyl cis-trans isomerase SlyD